MSALSEKLNYDEIKKGGTGSYEDNSDPKIIIYPFDKYEIKLQLTSDNKFVGILEIKINKDFLTHKQKTTPKGYHDVEEYYSE